jgi:hypothetical protein
MLPLVQTTRSLTTDSPRSLAAEPVGLSSHEYCRLEPDVKASETAATTAAVRRSGTFLTPGNLTSAT